MAYLIELINRVFKCDFGHMFGKPPLATALALRFDRSKTKPWLAGCAICVALTISVTSCAHLNRFDAFYREAIKQNIAHPSNIARTDAADTLTHCIENRVRGKRKDEREHLLNRVLLNAKHKWPEYVFLERIGLTYLSYKYTFIGLHPTSSRIILKNWKYSKAPLDITEAGHKLREIQLLFESFRNEVSKPWHPVGRSFNQHPGCFFLTIKLDEHIYQYAFFAPPFDSASESPPLRILKNLSMLTDSAGFPESIH